MSKFMKMCIVGVSVFLYAVIVMFNVVPQMVSAPDTMTNIMGVVIFVLSIPSISIIVKKVMK